MLAKKSVLKFFIIIILAIFLLSTGLISVLYLGGNKNAANGTGDLLSGDTNLQTGNILSGNTVGTTGIDLSGSAK